MVYRWVWEIQIVMAGLLPTASTAVGVMGLAMQISGISYMIPSSMGSATSTRVANSLGAGKARTAAAIAR
jgi:MATE family multidrug resistance protein